MTLPSGTVVPNLSTCSSDIAVQHQSLEDYLAQRGGVETVSAVSLHIDVGGLAAHSYILSRYLGEDLTCLRNMLP